MNIKRAFLIAVASLLVPGLALAQTTISFDTVLNLDPDGNYDQTVTATLTCNTGNPLQQSFEIGPTTADKVVFIVDNFDEQEFISCEISASTLSGFSLLSATANGVELAVDECVYAATPVQGESVALGTANTCVFRMAPSALQYQVVKEWEVNSEDDVVDLAAEVDWTCYNVANGPDGSFSATYNGSLWFYGPSAATQTVTGLHPNPDGTSYCTAEEDLTDSSIEADNGCSGMTVFEIGDGPQSCTIVNTVFFEGIPTLSQYGLIVMALLMLGVGFIGFRRFA